MTTKIYPGTIEGRISQLEDIMRLLTIKLYKVELTLKEITQMIKEQS